jgi:hypothetical protein
VENNLRKNKVASFAEVWEDLNTRNKSLHATINFFPGDALCNFGAREILTTPNYLSVQIDNHQHILLEPLFLQYINHSCSPNVYFDTSNMTIIALRKIKIGEEFTFFYPSTEWSMDRKFECYCGTQECLGWIQGAAQLPLDILAKYSLSEHVKQKFVEVELQA